MSKKTTPYIFLAVLGAILLFILGVRYGQRVELVNKNITLLISIPPTPTTVPTAIPLSFKEYIHPGCKASFLISNDLEKTAESSTSALFSTRSNKLGVALSCEKSSFIKKKEELSEALNKTITAYKTETSDTTSYRMYNYITGKVLTITVSKQYLPLLRKSLSVQ